MCGYPFNDMLILTGFNQSGDEWTKLVETNTTVPFNNIFWWCNQLGIGDGNFCLMARSSLYRRYPNEFTVGSKTLKGGDYMQH